jgi:hypothetical protein
MNMPVFNFHKVTNVHKDYAYQFSDLLPTKILESMCVLCAHTMHSKKVMICCKVQIIYCVPAFANPNP